MPERLRVVTANTAYAHALASENIRDFSGTDILLAQEVLGISTGALAKSLGKIGLQIAERHQESGLLIAFNPDKTNVQETAFHVTQPSSPLNGWLTGLGLKPRFRPRGLLTAKLMTGDTSFVAATTHPIVCVRSFARTNQVRAITDILVGQYDDTSMILGADMNHYPGPRRVDKQLLARTGLKLTHDGDPTFILKGTKHSWLRYAGLPDGQLDLLAARGFNFSATTLLDIASDHKAIATDLSI